MKNKLLRNIIIYGCIFLVIFSGAVLFLMNYYKQCFSVNTWINGIYCTGMKVDEVNKELLQSAEAPFLSIKDPEGNVYQISLQDAGFMVDYKKELERTWNVQKQSGILSSLYIQTVEEIEPVISLNIGYVLSEVAEMECLKDEREAERTVEIQMTENGYQLKNTLLNRIDEQMIYDHVKDCFEDPDYLLNGFKTGYYEINLTGLDCYKDMTPNAAEAEILEQWTVLESYIQCGIVYDMGDEQISLAGKLASDFIEVDESGKIQFDSVGHPVISESSIEEFINDLAEEYNTWKKELVFISTAGEEKKIPYQNYGTEINVKLEKEYLLQAFAERRSEVHIPEYTHQGIVRGKNDIGDTYIEVDMGNQKLYAYLNGELLVETDVVTGNMKNKTSTPEGVVYIYAKQRNRTLRGPGYASFVKYWIPVKGGIGLHDANWRSKFGGEIYLKNGSHGCINIPKAVMPEIYESFEIGTPVIMFY